MIKFKATYTNPAHNAGGANDEVKAETHLLRALERKPAVFIDDIHQGAFLFDRVDLYFNDEKIEVPLLGSNWHLYRAVNSIFATDETCLERYGRRLNRMRVAKERVATTTTIPDKAKEAAAALQFTSWNESEPNVAWFGLSGLFPFNFQSNLTRALYDRYISNRFLAPETRVRAHFHVRDHPEAFFDSMLIKDPNFVNSDDLPANETRGTGFKVDLSDMTILYQSFTPSTTQLAQMMKRTSLDYYVDVPKIQLIGVPDRKSWIQQTLTVPKGTRVLVVGWIHSNALFYDPAKGKPMHTRFTYLPNVKHLALSIGGREGEIFQTGYENLGLDSAWASPWAAAYHAELVRKGLYDAPFHSLFPKKDLALGNIGSRGYQQLLLFDLSDRKIEQDAELTLSMTFAAGETSPEKYFLFTISIQQYLYHQGADKRLTFKPLV